MKKVYSKPEIMFDSFSMTTNIASGCDIISKLPQEGTCGYQPPRDSNVYFVSSLTGCTHVPDDGPYNYICYHIPNDDTALFSS